MSEEHRLLECIASAPEADRPRLEYAAWLADRGDVRGEFIRVQCELANLAEDDPARGALERREAMLRGRLSETWPKALTAMKVGIEDVGFRRGMIEAVTLNDFDHFTERAGVLFAFAPTLTDVSINNACSIGFRGNEIVEFNIDAEALAASRYLPRLRSFALLNCELGPEGMSALAASEKAAGLTSLSILNDPIADDGACAIANSAHLSGLRELTLIRNDIGDPGADALAQPQSLPNLASLTLLEQCIGTSRIRSLEEKYGERLNLGES